MTEPLTLAAVCTATGTVRVWCPFCRRWYHHGGEGHVTAHCIEDASPYHQMGYTLALTGGLTPAVRRVAP